MATREALTIRFPGEVLSAARRYKPPEQSLNAFVVSAVEREAQHLRALEANARIREIRERVFRRAGKLPDSTPLIRKLREERSRRA